MTNINGKAYAMNAITPMKWWKSWIPRLVFLVLKVFPSAAQGLVDLSFIHFARWVIVKRKQFPRVTPGQRRLPEPVPGTPGAGSAATRRAG